VSAHRSRIVTAAIEFSGRKAGGRLCLIAVACALSLPSAAGADHDTSAPIVSFTLTGTAGTNGWFRSDVTIKWNVTEPEGLTSTSGCEIAKLVTSEGTTSHTCTATSHGGTASSTATLKIDKTLPSVPVGTPLRGPDSNGWYNHAVGVGFAANDAVSGIDTCAGGAYGGPDSASASVSGTCTDRAGNTSSGSFALQYDSTAPGVAAAASRAPDANGWYNRAVSVSFAQSPGDLSGPGSCSAPVTYDRPDSTTASVSGTCTDAAGNTSAPVTLAFAYDGTAPEATASPSRAANAAGWFNAPLTISFAQAPGDVSGSSGCTPAVQYAGPDAASVSKTGTCTDGAGNSSAPASLAFAYDASAPTLPAATPARGPDVNGWYNSALSVSFAATDVGPSGIEACDARTYAAPDSAAASVAGSCRDRAGNTSAPAAFGFKFDSTAPEATASPSRAANAAGWFNAPLTISFAQAPGDVSGSSGCSAAVQYGGPDADPVSRSGTCTDGAGNTSAPASLGFKYDASPPGLPAASPARGADANGWYNRPLAVTFAATDVGPSGIEACDIGTYGGPDSAAASVSGTCRDRAGNASAAATFGLQYDATAPAALAASSRPANANGWHRMPFTISFSQTPGDVSGEGACSPSLVYSGPDAATVTRSGTCTDGAGNTSAATSITFGYDASSPALPTPAPARGPDANGWYSHELAIAFTAADVGPSGIESCSAPVYTAPDSGSATVAGTCTDEAGNTSAPAIFGFRYDATPPVVVAVPDHGDGGWYREPVSVSFAGTDAGSGIASCSTPATYAGPDTSGTTVRGSCSDAAGNVRDAAFTVRLDSTPPSVSAALDRGPDANGWYNRPVRVTAQASDSTSGVESCSGPAYAGPDTAGVSLGATCRDRAGNVGAAGVSLRYDATAPAVTASPDRPPGSGGWYRGPFTVAFAGTDGMSGVESCTLPIRYKGPDRDGRLVGACRDGAGNPAEAAYAFRYDATPPELGRPSASIAGGVARLTWTRPPDAVSVEVMRTPGRNGARSTIVYDGRAGSFVDRTVRRGVRYRYELSATDAAANVARASVTALWRLALYRPAAGAAVRGPVQLGWEAVAGARFYNVQLRRDGAKVLSVWPKAASFRLRRAWTYDGEKFELEPGAYTWWVWAARGTRERPQYGRPLGRSTFVVRR
jgi:hypothetical protein